MEDNTHEVVKLLLARMKSHPEEFAAGANRWGWMVNDVLDHCSKEEAEAIKEGLRPIRLQEIHEHVMDELCNGDERRRKAQQEDEYQRQMVMQQYAAQQSNALAGQYAQAQNLQSMQSMGIGNIAPSQKLTLGVAGNEAMRIQANGELHLGGEKLDAGMIRKMKKALGI